MSAHETPLMGRLRTENLAGLSGRVLEVGAGTGTNFAHYPYTVAEVVALEPEILLAPKARRLPPPRGCRSPSSSPQSRPLPPTEPFDAVVCSLVLCSVEDPGSVLSQLHSLSQAGWGTALLRARRQSGLAVQAAAVSRRHGVAAHCRQLSHPPADRAGDCRGGLHGSSRPAPDDPSGLGADARCRGRIGARDQGLAQQFR